MNILREARRFNQKSMTLRIISILLFSVMLIASTFAWFSIQKDIRFGGSTVAEKGCAPAVATMISNQYGKKLTMRKAVSESSRYQNQNGTTADYFSKVLNSQGIGTNYITGKNIPNKVLQNLQYHPVILY